MGRARQRSRSPVGADLLTYWPTGSRRTPVLLQVERLFDRHTAGPTVAASRLVRRRHLQDESDHKIGAALGRAQSTVSRLRRAPDIAAMIAEERAKINAAENEQANAVKRERAREQSRKSSAVRRERKAKAQFEQGRSQAFRRENGKALTGQEAAALEALLYPERAPLARVVLAAGSFGYDPRDDAEVVRIARLIADEPEVASLDHDDLRTRLPPSATASTRRSSRRSRSERCTSCSRQTGNPSSRRSCSTGT
jgi:hypothetical protein